MAYHLASALLLSIMAATAAAADLKVMVAIDPSDRESMIIGHYEIQRSLARVVGGPVQSFKSQDLGDVMRSTRTGEYDVYIAPAHVAASALAHGYTLVGSTEPDEVYDLVSRAGKKAPADLSGGKLYLTQQDSVAAYMARGMLNESGQSLKMFQKVFYRNTSGAGLFAIEAGLVDATVAKRSDVQSWAKVKNSNVIVMMSSRAVPGGMSIIVKNTLPEATRKKLADWFLSPAGTTEARRLGDDGEIGLHQRVAPPAHQLVRGAEQLHRIGVLPLGIGVGKELADVPGRGGAEDRVGQRVGDRVGVGVSGQAARRRGMRTPPSTSGRPSDEAVRVVADADAHVTRHASCGHAIE